MIIEVKNKYFSIKVKVDREDYKYLSTMKWYAYYSSNSMKIYTYTKKSDRSRIVWLHRLLVNCPKGMVVDHINGNGLDNRKRNLRICTREQNSLNIGKSDTPATSKYIGVYYNKSCPSKPWKASISINNKTVNLGQFSLESDAAKFRDKIALQIRGKYARLNFESIRKNGDKNVRNQRS